MKERAWQCASFKFCSLDCGKLRFFVPVIILGILDDYILLLYVLNFQHPNVDQRIQIILPLLVNLIKGRYV